MGYYQYTGTLGIGERLYTSIASGRLTDLTENITIMWRDYNVHMDGTTPWVNFPFNGQSAWIPKERIGNQAQTWVETQSKTTAPSSVTVGLWIGEEVVKLSWSGAAAGTDNSITGYIIQCSDSANGSTWSPWVNLTTVNSIATSGNAYVDVNGTRGAFRKYRIQTKGSAGVEWYSTWSGESARVKTNQLPEFVSINVRGTTYSNKPCIICTMAAEPDGQYMNLYCTVDGGVRQSMGGVASAGGVARLRLTSALSVGNHAIQIIARDAMGGERSYSFNIVVANRTWTRAIASGSVISGGGISHISDIVEMLNAVNAQRAYYRLAAISLPGSVGLYADWKRQMEAMATGLDGCKAQAGESAKARIAMSRSYPRADVVNWLRAYISEV